MLAKRYHNGKTTPKKQQRFINLVSKMFKSEQVAYKPHKS